MPVCRNLDTTGVWAHPSSRTKAKTEYLRDMFLNKSIEGLLAAGPFSLPLPTACACRMIPSASDPCLHSPWPALPMSLGGRCQQPRWNVAALTATRGTGRLA